MYGNKFKSHPMWVCGLKLSVFKLFNIVITVTPHVGVWIETPNSLQAQTGKKSHPMWVCGLKLVNTRQV